MRLRSSPNVMPMAKQATHAAMNTRKMRQQKQSVHFRPFALTAQNSSRSMMPDGITVSLSQHPLLLTTPALPPIVTGVAADNRRRRTRRKREKPTQLGNNSAVLAFRAIESSKFPSRAAIAVEKNSAEYADDKTGRSAHCSSWSRAY